jgi:hypothetical protein
MVAKDRDRAGKRWAAGLYRRGSSLALIASKKSRPVVIAYLALFLLVLYY